MSKQNMKKDLETALRRNKELQEHNARFAAALAQTNAFVEKGAEMLLSLGNELEATKGALAEVRNDLVAARAESAAAIAKATSDVAAAEEREQQHKRRFAISDKIGHRLWHALEMKHLKEAVEFRDVNVRKGEGGLELLKD